MGMGIPPLKIKILLESNPPKSRILVRRSGVRPIRAARIHANRNPGSRNSGGFHKSLKGGFVQWVIHLLGTIQKNTGCSFAFHSQIHPQPPFAKPPFDYLSGFTSSPRRFALTDQSQPGSKPKASSPLYGQSTYQELSY